VVIKYVGELSGEVRPPESGELEFALAVIVGIMMGVSETYVELSAPLSAADEEGSDVPLSVIVIDGPV
jgi:hypothetical protein